MQKLVVFFSLLFVFSCGSDKDKLIVKGNVKGLKKGILYLKKAKDSVLVAIDSTIINGESQFQLESVIDTPELYFIYLDKNDNEDERISFFADKGVTEINTTLDNFAFGAKIKGSKQQEVLEDYLKMISKFNNKNLELIKENFEANRSNDTALADKTKKMHEGLEKRKYLYTVNFAINNKDSEVAPYLALTELYNANIKLLDTINNSLTPKIKSSLYGKKLQTFVDNIKEEEKQ